MRVNCIRRRVQSKNALRPKGYRRTCRIELGHYNPRPMNRFIRFTSLIALATAARAATPDWTYQLPAAAKWHQVTYTGSLLVGTPGSLLCVDPETGQLLWQRDDLDNTAPFTVREVTGTPFLIVNKHTGPISAATKTDVVVLEMATGQDVWRKEMKGAAVGFYPLATKNLAVLAANLSTQEDGQGTYLVAFKLDTGDQLWQTKLAKGNSVPLHIAENSGKFFVKTDLSGHYDPVVDGDTLLVPFIGVHCVDLATGAIKWNVPFKAAHPGLKKACAAPVADGDTVYGAGLGEVYAINKADGTVKWKSQKIRSGIISELQVFEDAVYVRVGGNFYDPAGKKWTLDPPLMVLALDPANGQQLWEFRNIKDGITNLKPIPSLKTVMVADARNLIGLDATSRGKAQEKFRVPLKFTRSIGGGEVAAKVVRGLTGGLLGIAKAAASAGSDKERLDIPVAIYDQDGGKLVVRGKQHLLSFDPTGQQIIWATYYPAPGAPAWEMAIMTTLTAFSAVTYSVAPAAGTMSSSAAVQGKEQAYARFDKTASVRYQKTKTAGDFTYILTTIKEGEERGIGLIAVDMKTGDAGKQVVLREKDPDYDVDDVTGRLFFFKGKKVIEAFSLR